MFWWNYYFLVTPRGAYPHTKRVGDFIFVSHQAYWRTKFDIHALEERSKKLYKIQRAIALRVIMYFLRFNNRI